MSPAIKATTAYGVQFGGCRISAAAKAIAQKMRLNKEPCVPRNFFQINPSLVYSVVFILQESRLCSRHQTG